MMFFISFYYIPIFLKCKCRFYDKPFFLINIFCRKYAIVFWLKYFLSLFCKNYEYYSIYRNPNDF